MKALIYDNVVVQIEEKEFPVAPPLIWIECTNEVVCGDIYDVIKKIFTTPSPTKITFIG